MGYLKVLFAGIIVASLSFAAGAQSTDSLLERADVAELGPEVVITLLSKSALQATDPHELATVHDRIAHAYRELGIPDSASVHAWHVMRLAPDDHLLRGRAYSLLGYLSYQAEAWGRAADYYAGAERQYRMLGDKPGMLNALSYQARVDLTQNFRDPALRKYLQARTLALELRDVATERQLVLEMAGLFRTMGRYSDAEDYLARSFALSAGDTLQMARARRELGKLYEDRGEFRKAWNLYGEVIGWVRQRDPFPVYADLVRVSTRLNLVDTTSLYADSLERAAIRSGNVRYLRDGYQALFQLADQKKDSARAYAFLLKFKLYDDSVDNMEWKQRVKNARNELFLSASEASVRTAELESSLSELSVQSDLNRLTFTWFASILGVVLAVFLSLWYFTLRRSRMQKKELDARLLDLESKNAKVFGVLAHDLQGPVSTFGNLTRSLPSLLKETPKDELGSLVRNLHVSAQEVQQSLHELIDWAISQSGAMPFRPEVFGCLRLAEEVKEELQAWADEHDVLITLLVPESVTPCADRAMVKIVLRTLVFNAIRFSREKEAVTLFSGMKENLITIGVKDHGPGIPGDKLEDLLSWNQPGGAAQEKGVGLPMCRELVRRNGGDLLVESQPGEGSTFYFTLPDHQA